MLALTMFMSLGTNCLYWNVSVVSDGTCDPYIYLSCLYTVMLPLCPYIHKFRFGISPVSEVPVVVLPVGGNRHPAHGSDANWKTGKETVNDVTETIPIIIIIITNDCWAHRYWTAEIFSEEGGITVGRGLLVIWTKDLSVTGPHPQPSIPPQPN